MKKEIHEEVFRLFIDTTGFCIECDRNLPLFGDELCGTCFPKKHGRIAYNRRKILWNMKRYHDQGVEWIPYRTATTDGSYGTVTLHSMVNDGTVEMMVKKTKNKVSLYFKLV